MTACPPHARPAGWTVRRIWTCDTYVRASLLGVGLLLAGIGTRAKAADVTLTVQLRWQGAPLNVPTGELVNAGGQTLRITRFAALVSGVEFARADGSVVHTDGQYAWLDAESNRLSLTLRDVPPGEYVGLGFQLGLPATINQGDPARWPAGHPLNPIVNGLHWSWSGGYIFAALEGRWRPADAAPPASALERGFSYHLATDARLMRVGFATRFTHGESTAIGLALDLGNVLGKRILSGDDGSESTHSAPHDTLAATLATAVERAWFFLQAAPADAKTAADLRQVPATTAATATPRAFVVPAGFPAPELPADNPLSQEGIALGERLFQDRRLSAGGIQSCASCHHAERAFSDTVALSVGVDGKAGTRNAMPLFNLAWSPAYAWDGSRPRLRDQVLAAMINPIEMHADLAVVTAELNRDPALRREFATVFGTPDISTDRVALALEQYLLTLMAGDSKFDRAQRGQATLSSEEQRGFELFATEFDPVRGMRGADCFHCHGGALFSDFGYRDNGLGLTSADPGREAVTGRSTDRAKFKTPSLRNVALTAPYMHDGRFATLEDVVAHYDHGLVRTTNLDPNLAKHPDAGLQLSQEDQLALVAFLRTLTDSSAAAAH